MIRFAIAKALTLCAIAFGSIALSAYAVPFDRDGFATNGEQIVANNKKLAGFYTATGTNADGSTYSGEVEVRAVGENYYVVWCSGNAVFEGPAEVREGKLYWHYSGAFSGIAIYDIGPGGLLEGRWGTSENELAGTETWRRR